MPRPTRRQLLKTAHWLTLPLFVWFVLVQPSDVRAIGKWAVSLHSVMGLVFVTIALLWTADYWRRGLASTRAPKLSPRLRRFHRILHHTLVWGLFTVALTGFLLGLTSSRLLFAGTVLPIAPPMGIPWANDVAGVVHSVQFYLLAAIAVGHAGFHIWRHERLRDNALRIMFPRFLHRFL
ncbi:MAG: cytochrome b/b6 domain-containing protein [Pseudomonadota bacterium]